MPFVVTSYNLTPCAKYQLFTGYDVSPLLEKGGAYHGKPDDPKNGLPPTHQAGRLVLSLCPEDAAAEDAPPQLATNINHGSFRGMPSDCDVVAFTKK